MSKHTTGPWMVSENGPFRKQQVPTVYAADSDLRYIAFCADPNEMNTSPTDNLANARLISAAPDLLAACEDLLALVKGECPSLLDGDRDGDANTYFRVTAAIAKAKGVGD